MRFLLVPSFLILFVANGMSQVSIEQPVSSPVYGPAASDQFGSVAGSNGTDFLVAWLDGRAWPSAIYATRVTADGEVLDGTGIRIPLQNGANTRVLGAFWLGDAYTVVYTYQVFGTPTSSFFTAIARINDRGELIDPPRTVVDFFGRAAAANKSRIVVAGENVVAVLDDRAQLIDRTQLSATAYGVNIGTNGSTFLVSSFSYDGSSNWVNFIALDSNGRPTGSSRIAAAGIGDGPVIGSDGTDYLVLYRNPSSEVAQPVTAAGALGTSTMLPQMGISVLSAAMLWTGDAYLVAAAGGDSEQQMNIASLDRAGDVIAPPKSLDAPGTPGVTNGPSLAISGQKLLMTWTEGTQSSPNGFDTAGILLSRNGQPLSGAFVLATSSNPQRAPVIGTGGKNDLIVWYEPSGVYATRVSPTGVAMDGRGIQVAAQSRASRDVVYGQPLLIDVIFDGNAYLIAWGSGFGPLNGQRIDAETGALLGPPLTVAQCVISSSLARDQFGVVAFASDCSGQLFAQRISTSGAFGVPAVISPAQMATSAPRAAWNGNEWLVAWNELIPLPTLFPVQLYRHNVYAQRVSSSLNAIDATPIPIDVTQNEALNPFVATDGNDFLVAWSRPWNPSGVYARHIKSDGSFGGAQAPGITVAAGASAALGVVWDGSRYAVEYVASRDDGLDEVLLTHLASDVPVGDRIAISPEGADTREADIVISAPAHLRTVYARTATEPVYGGVTRIFLRDAVSVRQRAVHRR